MLTGKSVRIGGNRLVEYICQCGKIGWTRIAHLKNGKSKSCGCVVPEISRIRETTHGMSGSTLYSVWAGMKQRCYDENTEAYPYYGGRGVTVCDEWRYNFKAFYDWAKDKWAEGLELDKDIIYSKKHGTKNGLIYSPEYCCFVTNKDNCRKRKTTREVEYDGKIVSMAYLSEVSGVPYAMLINRINSGWSVGKAISK